MARCTRTAPSSVIGLAIGALALAGCSAGADPAGPTEVQFWGWAPGYSDAVDAFNASQDEVVVAYEEISPGNQGGYERLLNAASAGNAPCLAQVGYETLPSFVAQGALLDVTDIASADADQYLEAAWAAVNVGGVTYGAPVDTGPVAMFYRTDVFEEAGVEVPTTWEAFQAAGEAIREQNPERYLTSQYLNYDYAGFAQQAGADWFGIEGDSWQVSIDSAENQRVADYWQGLRDADLISPAPMWDQSWYTALSDGSIAAHVGAVWLAGILEGSAADGAGNWAVAPMPQWEGGDAVTTNVGGSATAIMNGCESPEAAWAFANFMSTDEDAYTGLVESASLYPAATALLELPALQEGVDYFGGQPIYEVFREASTSVPAWTWGPAMPTTVTALDDALSSAWSGSGTVSDALAAAQTATVQGLEAEGVSVEAP